MPNKNSTQACILTYDIEEWFQVENLKGAISRKDWELQKSTVEKNTDRILGILEEFSIPATFFILGWVAERHPALVKKIHAAGHEIACHGYGHELANRLEESQIRQDIHKSKKILEDLISEPVVGYRAPNFSISDQIISYLKEMDFVYDSSYNPFTLNPRYGSLSVLQKKVAPNCYLIENGLYEIPISYTSIFKFSLPISGGAYFRIIPFWIFKRLINSNQVKNTPNIFYLHPWEFEPEQQRIRNIKWNYQFRHYYGLKNTENKLKKLIVHLKDLKSEFLTMHQYIKGIC
jgi:polysaccharide deacetylase family protein (PEP-CTERM system associated)